MSEFFLQVELQPVVQTHDLLPVFGLPDEDVFKSTGVLTRKVTTITKTKPKYVYIALPQPEVNFRSFSFIALCFYLSRTSR